MSSAKSLALEDHQVHQKIRRMAYEIYENNFPEEKIVLAGIDGQGFALAELLQRVISEISPLKVKIIRVTVDKDSPLSSEILLDVKMDELKKRTVILVDDVLNTGKTLAYAMKPFLSVELKKLEVAVLVNRSHPLFPVQPTYTGYELSTTLSDQVEVVLGKKSAVYLH
jgi:pyrimidine operon attenuation protein / uracil phosphoribosyltransferase